MKEETKRLFDEARRQQAKGNIQAAINLYREAGKESAPAKRLSEILICNLEKNRRDRPKESVDIVLPVFNAVDYTELCIESIFRAKTHLGFRLILVNDGSDKKTSIELRKAQARHSDNFYLVENEANLGYTKSVNIGLAKSTANYIVVLNSDTIVSDYWLDNLLLCMQAKESIGITGPLSNAASYQTVPSVYGDDGSFCVHELDTDKIHDAAALISKSSHRIYPEVPIVNGFCYMIKRCVIEKIGMLDEESFPVGYGEENDFCLRAVSNGFTIAVADDTYVYHFKSKTFGPDKKKELSTHGRQALITKHGKVALQKAEEALRNSEELEKVRKKLQPVFNTLLNTDKKQTLSVCFVLPVKGGGGGAHSVVQEANGLRKIGVDAYIAVRQEQLDNYITSYPSFPMRDILIPITPSNATKSLSRFDAVIATIYQSVKMVSRTNQLFPWIVPFYYIQDYEPLFHKEGSIEWKEAYASYTLNPNFVCFAKTDWICRTVLDNHGVKVSRVNASIDRDLYYPEFSKSPGSQIVISAMVRPSTPRRAAGRTIKALSLIKKELGDLVDIHIFGCSDKDVPISELGVFYTNHGAITREQVAIILRYSTIFCDFSDYQAFGRTGLEAMACGCIPLLPISGGADEYAVHDFNSIVVDTKNINEAVRDLSRVILSADKIQELRINALNTASRYSIINAVISEALLLSNSIERFQSSNATKKLVFNFSARACRYVNQSPYHQEYLRNYLTTDASNEGGNNAEPSNTFSIGDAEVALIDIQHKDGGLGPTDNPLSSSNQFILPIATPYNIEHIHPIPQNLDEFIDATIWQKNLDANGFNKIVAESYFYFDIDFWTQALDKFYQNKFSKSNHDAFKIGLIGCSGDAPIVEEMFSRLRQALSDRELGNVSFESIGIHQEVKNNSQVEVRRIGLPRQRDYFSYAEWLKLRLDWDAAIVFRSYNDESFAADARYRICQYSSMRIAPILYGLEGSRLFTFLREGENICNIGGSIEGLASIIRDLPAKKTYADKIALLLLQRIQDSGQVRQPDIFSLISPTK